MRINRKPVLRVYLLTLAGLLFSTSYAEVPQPPNAEQLQELNEKLHRLRNEIDEVDQGRKQSRTVYLNQHREKEYPYDDYLMLVRERMQKIGIEHYASLGLEQLTAPAMARVSITLNHDGKVTQLQFLGKPGDQIVESAVRTIVNMAQPFVPFPTPIKREADKLVFTNSWYFVPAKTPAQ